MKKSYLLGLLIIAASGKNFSAPVTYGIDFVSANANTATKISLSGSFNYDSTLGPELLSGLTVNMNLQYASNSEATPVGAISASTFDFMLDSIPGVSDTVSDKFTYAFGPDDTYNVILNGGGLPHNRILDSGDFMISTVPIPAAAWLFGSGLIGLIGIARRIEIDQFLNAITGN